MQSPGAIIKASSAVSVMTIKQNSPYHLPNRAAAAALPNYINS